MDKPPIDGLERLCQVYGMLNDEEKGKIIRLAEGLLNSKKNFFDDEIEEKVEKS